MLMLIAPSKTQRLDVESWPDDSSPTLLAESEVLISELRKYSVDALGKLMNMSEKLAVQTYERIHSFQTPFTKNNAKSALSVFEGDVYSRIESAGYKQQEREYLQAHLRILSGLYGVLRPSDLMQPYRLEMGCKLENSRGKTLYEFWGDLVTDELNRTLMAHQEPILVNLASAEYIRVIKKKKLKGRMLQVDFKEQRGDIYKTVAIHAKRARGMMVDFAVKNNVRKVQELQAFQRGRYSFHRELSTESQYLFTRDE
jgi:hypothetical protein